MKELFIGVARLGNDSQVFYDGHEMIERWGIEDLFLFLSLVHQLQQQVIKIVRVLVVLFGDRKQEHKLHRMAIAPIDAIRNHCHRDDRFQGHQRHRMRDGQHIVQVGLAKVFPLHDACQESVGCIVISDKIADHGI